MSHKSGIGNIKNTVRRIFTEKNVAVFALIILGLSLILPVYVGFFNYATGDDLLYGAILRNGFRHKESLGVLAGRVWDDVVSEYKSFQGTWASQILWRLEPSIWGEKVFVITIFISLGILLSGIGYMTRVVIVRFLGYNKWIWLFVSSLVLFYTIQFMPYFRGGLYWYTGMVQYTLAYGVSMFSIGWSILYVMTGQKKYLIGDMITLAYLGGAGFPAIVQCGMIIFFVAVWSYISSKDTRKRSLMLIIPLILLAIGFGISALAPGNSVRGGEDYGFSWMRIAQVFTGSFRDGISYSIGYILSVRPIFLLPVLTLVSAMANKDTGVRIIKVKEAVIAILLGFAVVCMVHSPEIFAGSTVAAGFSGGVYNIYFFVFVMWLTVSGLLIGNVVRSIAAVSKSFDAIRKGAFIFAILFVILCWRFLVGNSLDYLCWNYVSSGALHDYEEQMDERLEILQDDSIKDAVVPEMNDEQGPLMHMPLTADPDKYTNYATALFYEKDSVIAIPRDEWNNNN